MRAHVEIDLVQIPWKSLKLLLKRSKPTKRKFVFLSCGFLQLPDRHAFTARLFPNFRHSLIRKVGSPVLYNVNHEKEISRQKRALLMYLFRAFLKQENDGAFLRHQNLRRCKLIAEALGKVGYVVDVMDHKDFVFLPDKNYSLFITGKVNLKQINRLNPNASKIFLATSGNHVVHNRSSQRRHQRLAERRGFDVTIRRLYDEKMPFLSVCDAILGVGNEYSVSTWKSVFSGPIYPFNNCGHPSIKYSNAKDYSTARQNFLFFASTGQVQKGLDLLLEIFPRYPHLHLYVCSNFEKERDFCRCYHRELYGAPNVHPIGWVRLNSAQFYELVQQCAYVIHPTCSEGQAGSVVQCMHAGLIPMVTREAGIDTEEFGITFRDDSVEEIERIVVHVSQLPESWHRMQSGKTRSAAVTNYSEEAFLERWSKVLIEILEKPRQIYRGPLVEKTQDVETA